MTQRAKTTPENNFHCFSGAGYGYWLAIAQGFRPMGIRKRVEGHELSFEQDIDGCVVQNGGMYSPKEVKLSGSCFARFFATNTHNVRGPGAGMTGRWWVDDETLVCIEQFAVANTYSLAKAAALLLIVPPEWGDCCYVGLARRTKPMKAFVGRGSPASGKISPASAERARGGYGLYGSPPHLGIKQYFIPGSSDEIGSALQRIWIKQSIHKSTVT